MDGWLRRRRRALVIATISLITCLIFTTWTVFGAPIVSALLGLASVSILGAIISPVELVTLFGAYGCAIVASGVLDRVLGQLYRRIEQAREHAIRQETVVYMAATMAHEVFQPLTVIQAGVQFLCRHQVPPDRQRELCDRVVKSTKALADVVRRFENTTEAAIREYGGTRLIEMDDGAHR